MGVLEVISQFDHSLKAHTENMAKLARGYDYTPYQQVLKCLLRLY